MASTHRSLIRPLLALAAAVMLAVQGIAAVFHRSLDYLGASVLRVVATFKRDDINPIALDRPLVAFVRAKAFVLRLAKRQRPDTTPGWRMCPST